MAVAGTYAYVADGTAGLRVVNIANPAAPAPVGFYDTPGQALGVTVDGNYAYVADDTAGLRVVNIANPAEPSAVGFYDTPGAGPWRRRGRGLRLCGGRRSRTAGGEHRQPGGANLGGVLQDAGRCLRASPWLGTMPMWPMTPMDCGW